MSELPPIAATAGEPSKRVKRKRREKKQAIEISLWINKTKYEFGLLCTFCAKIPAVCHCSECTDFYCKSCDITAHNTKKRKDHIRNPLSKLDLNAAASIVTRAVRRFGLLRVLQNRAREVFVRRFDIKSLNYYYYNKLYKTVSWRKPYCLRKLELFPYMTPTYAASKCQNVYHLWRARDKTRKELLAQYKKIFDRRTGLFYYAYNGKSKLIPRSNWRRPRFLGKRSFPKDILPIYTIDVAAIIIQRKWRGILMRQFLQALVRATHDEVWDPVKGKYNYFNRDSEQLFQDRPLLLRNEAWDPNRIPDWDMNRVSLFLRRIGLKQYVDVMRQYFVDGNALILLDDEDFENMKITTRIHIKKLKVEMEKIYIPHKKIAMSEEHMARREKIRRQKMFLSAAILIQRQFRRFSAARLYAMMKEIRRIQTLDVELNKRIEASGAWWTLNSKLQIRKKEKMVTTISSTGVKLPPIKTYGRRRDFLSAKGWGRRGPDLKGSWTTTEAAKIDANFMGESHPTLIFTEKLRISGYDKKRERAFVESDYA